MFISDIHVAATGASRTLLMSCTACRGGLTMYAQRWDEPTGDGMVRGQKFTCGQSDLCRIEKVTLGLALPSRRHRVVITTLVSVLMMKNFVVELVASLSCIVLLISWSSASRAASPGEVQTSFTLYVWAPSMDGKLKYDLGGGTASLDAGDILNALDMAFMGAFEVRQNEWSMLADVIYLDLSDDKVSRVGLPGGGAIKTKVDLQLSGWQIGLYGGYSLYRTELARLDVLAGARYLSLDADAGLSITGPLPPSLPTANLSRSASIWDAVIGFRGRLEVNQNWFVPYHADVGAGDSDLTWQAMVGIGYEAGWGDIMMIYRHLEWDQGDDELLQGLSFSGPALALRYRF